MSTSVGACSASSTVPAMRMPLCGSPSAAPISLSACWRATAPASTKSVDAKIWRVIAAPAQPVAPATQTRIAMSLVLPSPLFSECCQSIRDVARTHECIAQADQQHAVADRHSERVTGRELDQDAVRADTQVHRRLRDVDRNRAGIDPQQPLRDVAEKLAELAGDALGHGNENRADDGLPHQIAKGCADARRRRAPKRGEEHGHQLEDEEIQRKRRPVRAKLQPAAERETRDAA